MTYLSRFAATLTVAAIALGDRLRAAVDDDRGDSPVSTAIIVALLAVAAVAVATAITAAANGWLGKIPKVTP
jgi:hypothetical protein